MNRILTSFIILLLLVACKTPEARRPISVKTGSFIDESVARNKKLNEKEQALIEQLMAENEETEYVASENGFWYYYNQKITDTTATPNFGDIVNYSYNLKDLKGNLIYPKTQFENLNYAMDRQELFTGLREGLKLMRAGETVTFLFPSQKAYGYYGDEDKIGTNVPLIAEVTVNSISQPQDQ
ncbi:MAG: gliding motility-associated peptidyl-prolyl isomerase GldI [Jejuia sp.]